MGEELVDEVVLSKEKYWAWAGELWADREPWSAKGSLSQAAVVEVDGPRRGVLSRLIVPHPP